MTRDRLEDAFLRLRDAADADEYVPMEDVIETVLARLARAEKENRWEAYAAFGSNYKDVTAEVIALREERDEALRLLATRVEAKRLDEAQEEIAALREACTLALNVMEQKNRVNVPPFAKFITVEFAPEDIAVLRAALEKKP
jgi:hypothetical protein